MPRTAEEMREYQRQRREKARNVTTTECESSTVQETAPQKPVTRQPDHPELIFDLARDLKLDMEKDLGIIGWTRDGIFIRPDITITQIRNIQKLVAAKNGRQPKKIHNLD